MTTQYALNYNLDITNSSGATSNNSFSAVWKLTRCMKAAGWTYKASGDGHNKDTTGTASNDRWGVSVNPMNDVYPATTIAQASAGVAASSSIITVVSTAGFPTGGGTFNIATLSTNVTYTGISGNTFTGCTGGSGTMQLGYGVTLLDTYSAWWCAEGPSTVKIGISAASSGTFIRGEQISQATSGATGELLGYVINAAVNSGWLSILPRTGTFDGTHVITGASSGATVTATAYNLIRRQIVLAKDTTTTNGWYFYEALSDTEIAGSSNTALFSDLAANAANCTSTVAPGNSAASNNLFPSFGISVLGTGGGGSSSTIFNATTLFGKAQIVAVNAVQPSSTSADGSFFCAVWGVGGTLGSSDAWRTIGFFRLDDTEPGDVDPFICYTGGTTESSLTSTGRTQGSQPQSVPSWGTWAFGNSGATVTPAKGYVARTTGTMGSGFDVYSGFTFGVTQYGPNVAPPMLSLATQYTTNNWNFNYPKVRNHPDALAGITMRPIEMFTVNGLASGIQIRKGVCRWLGITSSGWVGETIDNKNWLVILSAQTQLFAGNNPGPAVIIGPLDGATALETS